jgi:hypothetical protein
MALGLAAPALAYTTNTPAEEGSSPYTIEIYLVEHSGLDLLGNALQLPATDRGYAKNEIIAAIGKLVIPKGLDIWADGYTQLQFKPTNVSLAVHENNPDALYSSPPVNAELVNNLPAGFQTGGGGDWEVWPWNPVSGVLSHAIAGTPGGAGDGIGNPGGLDIDPNYARTLRWLVFGKVNDDDASLTFRLQRAPQWVAPTTALGFYSGTGLVQSLISGVTIPALGMVLNDDFVVYAAISTNGTDPDTANLWLIHANPSGLGFDVAATAAAGVPDDLLFAIHVDNANGRTARLLMFPNGETGVAYRITVAPGGTHLIFEVAADPSGKLRPTDVIKYDTPAYASLLAFYEEWFEKKLGFSAYNEGNLLRASDWETIAAAAIDISDTVDIEPLTAYVKVPENIVVDPPKTGEAASAAGFITLLLAAAAMVVVKKVRA